VTQTITMGGVSITPQEISSSLFASMIVFPPVLLIAYFFSKAESKSSGHGGERKWRTQLVPDELPVKIHGELSGEYLAST